MKRTFLITLAALAIMALSVPLHASAQTPSGQWSFSITPYLWAPDIDMTLKYSVPPGSGGGPEVEVQPNDYLENLDMAMMISGEARKDRWAMFTDFIYLDFSAEESTVKAVDFGGNLVSSGTNVMTELYTDGCGLDARRGLCGPAGPARGFRCLRRPALFRPGGLDRLATRPDSHRPERRANLCANRQHLGERGSLGWDRRRQGALLARPKQLVDPLLLRHGHRLVESDLAGHARH